MAKGASIVQQGVSVEDAIDAQKVLDTRWKYFEIYKEVEVSFPTMVDLTSYNFTLYEHRLGFVPFFEVFSITANAHIAKFNTAGGPNVTNLSVIGGIVSDKDRIYFFGLYLNDDGFSKSRVLIRIYNVDAAKEYQAPLVNVKPNRASRKSSIGAKVIQHGDLNVAKSSELSDYTLTTRGKPLAIQRVGVASSDTSTGFVVKVDHNMGTLPIFLAAPIKLDRSIIGALNPDFVPFLATATTSNLTFSGAQAALIGVFSYIIFKELAEVST